MTPGTLVADARRLPFGAASFDVVATSPAYGNRLADHHEARDGSARRSYTHTLGRTLAAGNAGTMPYRDRQGDDAPYRVLHRAAWAEVRRVLAPGGLLVVNVSDFYAGGERQHVSGWHLDTLRALGFGLERTVTVSTPRLRFGANRSRVEGEQVSLLQAPGASS
jgi:tRNA G10  N-methylase Trm11